MNAETKPKMIWSLLKGLNRLDALHDHIKHATISMTYIDEGEGELFHARSEQGPILTAEITAERLHIKFYTQAFETPLDLTAPRHLLQSGSHVVIVRYREATVELFVDGVLMDESDLLDCPQYKVPKTAVFQGGNRRLAAGFQTKTGYGGQLVWRELVQHADGTLGTAFVPEFTSALLGAEWPLSRSSYRLCAWEGMAEAEIPGLPEQYYIHFEATPILQQGSYGFSVGCADFISQGWDVRFEPELQKVGIHEMNSRSWQQNEQSSLYVVPDLFDKVIVEAFVGKDFIDLCINGSRTLISSLEPYGGKFRFFSQFGEVEFSNVRIHALGEEIGRN